MRDWTRSVFLDLLRWISRVYPFPSLNQTPSSEIENRRINFPAILIINIVTNFHHAIIDVWMCKFMAFIMDIKCQLMANPSEFTARRSFSARSRIAPNVIEIKFFFIIHNSKSVAFFSSRVTSAPVNHPHRNPTLVLPEVEKRKRDRERRFTLNVCSKRICD